MTATLLRSNNDQDLELRLGLYSDKALKILALALSHYKLQVFNIDPIDGFVSRAGDGELALDCKTYGNFIMPWTNVQALPFKDCLEERCQESCSHYWECVKNLLMSHVTEALRSFMAEMSSMLDKVDKDFFEHMLDELSEAHAMDNSEVIGKPLDPFRLEIIKTLRHELEDRQLHAKNLEVVWRVWLDKETIEELEKLKEEYFLAMGLYTS